MESHVFHDYRFFCVNYKKKYFKSIFNEHSIGKNASRTWTIVQNITFTFTYILKKNKELYH